MDYSKLPLLQGKECKWYVIGVNRHFFNNVPYNKYRKATLQTSTLANQFAEKYNLYTLEDGAMALTSEHAMLITLALPAHFTLVEI